jgi:hypothetical protein
MPKMEAGVRISVGGECSDDGRTERSDAMEGAVVEK